MRTSIVTNREGFGPLLGRHCPTIGEREEDQGHVLVSMYELDDHITVVEGAFATFNTRLDEVHEDPDLPEQMKRTIGDLCDLGTEKQCYALKFHEKLKTRHAVMEHTRWMPAYVQEDAGPDEPGASPRDKAHAEAIRDEIADIKAMLGWLRSASQDSFLNAQALPVAQVTKDVAEHLVVGMTTCVDSALDMVDTSIGELERLIGQNGTEAA